MGGGGLPLAAGWWGGTAARFPARPETRLAATSTATNGKSVSARSPSCHSGGRGPEGASRAGRGDARSGVVAEAGGEPSAQGRGPRYRAGAPPGTGSGSG